MAPAEYEGGANQSADLLISGVSITEVAPFSWTISGFGRRQRQTRAAVYGLGSELTTHTFRFGSKATLPKR